MKAKNPKKAEPKRTPEEMGNMLVAIYESGYLDKKQAYKMSFIKGVLSGLGGAVGATIVLALLIWVLSLFQNVPLVGHFVDTVRHTVNARQR